MSHFQPKDPRWQEKVRESFAKQGIMAHLGAAMTALSPGHCEISVPYRLALSQQMGFFHAGVTSTILDSAGGYAGFSLMAENTEVLSVEFKINLLAPADGDQLIGQGRVVRAGKSIVVTQIDGWVEKKGVRHHCAIMQQTLMTMVLKH